ncbi:MAG: MMPL family transporter [Candidatus Thermoplasmatota archaeon]
MRLTELVARAVTRYPMQIIALTVIISLILGLIYFSKGERLELHEETYLPENELVNAYRTLKQDYTAEPECAILIVKSNENVLRANALREILEIENEFLKDDKINSTLVSMHSLPDIILASSELLKFIDKLCLELPAQFENLNSAIKNFNIVAQLAQYNATISSAWSSNNTTLLAQALITANETLSSIVNLLQLSNITVLFRAQQIPALNISTKIDLMSKLDDEDIRDIILNITCYNSSKTDILNQTSKPFLATLNSIIKELKGLRSLLLSLSSAQELRGLLLEIESLKNSTSKLINILESSTALIATLDERLDSYAGITNQTLHQLLSVDFNGSSTKACVIMLWLNSSLLPQESEKEKFDRFLSLENKMANIVASKELNYTEMNVVGKELTDRAILTAAENSINRLLPLAFILMIVVLALAYKNILEILFSVLAVGLSILWTWGFGALLGFKFNPITIAVPVLIVGLGIDFGIHLILRYKEELRMGSMPKESIIASMRSVGTAMMLCVFTTVIAFLSNLSSDMPVVREFCILCAFGIASAFILTLTFMTSCKYLVEAKKVLKRENPKLKDKIGKIASLPKVFFNACAKSAKHPIAIICVVLLLTGVSTAGALNLRTEYRLEDFLPENLEVTQSIKFLRNEFNITTETVYILVSGNCSSALVLKKLGEAINRTNDDKYILKEPQRAKVSSILSLMEDVATDDCLKRPFDLYNEEFRALWLMSDTNNDKIPDKDIPILYDWLYKNETTSSVVKYFLRKSANDNYSGTVVRIYVDTENGKRTGELYESLREDIEPLNELLGNELNQVTITGIPILSYITLKSLNESMLKSLIITLIIALVTLTLVLRITRKSWCLGIITTFPVILVLAWILGTMFVLRIPYNVLTISITALTIGLGIDYQIHITNRFCEERDKRENLENACENAAAHTGSALFASALTTIAAFGLLVFALLPPMRQFGVIVALTILYSFIASVVLLPTLLMLWAKWRAHSQPKSK